MRLVSKSVFAGIVVGAALSAGAVGAAAAATIADSSFEDPVTGGFYYRPVVSGVVFTGNSGVARGLGFDPAPDGAQNAFLQSTSDSGAQIDIDVAGLIAGNAYSFSFMDDQRSGYGVNPYSVLFDGVSIGSFSPASSGWTSRTTSIFTAQATSGVLTFSTPLMGYDNDVGLDKITLKAIETIPGGVPEPSTWALMLVGFGGLGVALRRQRRTASALA